ncbi:MAG: phenylalanine--tRNA ligase beta subunit-related protein [Paludibacter sp.]|jgi:DNA/RNA-binding domain of Phe-tRNA-synthetase-like protein|nr:phenylalanine--tRNA ligase beta subunit-related protein [Paludibacter sp.]
MQIIISDEIQKICPSLTLGIVQANVLNSPTPQFLSEEMTALETEFRQQYTLEELNKRPAILATRLAYKALGKEPGRYRPSAEALCRRILREIPLYRVDTLVDIINIVSVKTGFSIGAFDLNKIEGEKLTLGVGKAGEEFEAIGRGQLNIEGLPVYRDTVGGIGTPTSDHDRTKITSDTRQLLVIINGYNGEEGLQRAINLSVDLLKKYADAKEIQSIILSNHQ